ncbi:MAG: hypothetical protein HFJ24_05475 [Clostridia bacterium]|nr:hypothetical protein [Clostridia bacterium]MCI9275407.1 hypothetical protein [Clostridia bacterium]
MKFIGKEFGKKEIILAVSVLVIIIVGVSIAFLFKDMFNSKTLGATGEKIEHPEELIGKYIAYTPENGSYSDVTSNKKYTGTDINDNDFITDTSINWRIWDVDEQKITIIADRPVLVGGYRNLGGLSLADCIGYNNAVKILNDICKACYSNGEYNATGRSFNVDDIESKLDIAIWRPERYKVKEIDVRTNSGRKEYKVNRCYPYIYKEEKFGIIDEVENTEGIGKSEQIDFYTGKESYIKAEKALNPMQTAWTNGRLEERNFINPNYYNMIFKDGFDHGEALISYYLASRAVDLNDSHIEYGIFEVSMGRNIKVNELFNSRGASIEYWDRIRPVVEIPLEGIRLNRTNDGMTKDTAILMEKQ